MIALLVGIAMVSTGVSAESSTGGNSVGPGGTVVTGKSSASVHVENRISGSSGTSTVIIETSVNGQKSYEKIVKPVSATSSIIRVATSSRSGPLATSSVRSSGSVRERLQAITDTLVLDPRSSSTSKERSSQGSTSAAVSASSTSVFKFDLLGIRIVSGLRSMFGKIFGGWLW